MLQSVGGVETSDARREGRASCIEVCVGGLICGDALSVWLTMMMRLFAPLALWS